MGDKLFIIGQPLEFTGIGVTVPSGDYEHVVTNNGFDNFLGWGLCIGCPEVPEIGQRGLIEDARGEIYAGERGACAKLDPRERAFREHAPIRWNRDIDYWPGLWTPKRYRRRAPTNDVLVANLTMHCGQAKAPSACAIGAYYVRRLTMRDVTATSAGPDFPARIMLTGCDDVRLTRVKCQHLQLNSCTQVRLDQCEINYLTLEEACADVWVVRHAGGAMRVGDNSCVYIDVLKAKFAADRDSVQLAGGRKMTFDGVEFAPGTAWTTGVPREDAVFINGPEPLRY